MDLNNLLTVGKVNLCSPDHISLLVHRTFNVSIPRRQIPGKNWEFEYGAAENDPEFGHERRDFQDGGTEEMSQDAGGKWVHRATGESLANKMVEFTVIGYVNISSVSRMNSLENRLTVANEMLSLLGSLQDEPFLAKYYTMKAPSEISCGEDSEEGRVYEGKRKTSRSKERADSELRKRKRK